METQTKAVDVMLYVIRAEARSNGNRGQYAGPFSLATARAWKPNSFDKKYFRYFKIARYRG